MRFYLKNEVNPRRRDIYYVCWTDEHGQGHRRSTRTADYKEAQLMLGRMILEHDKPKDLRPEQTTLKYVLVQYWKDRKDDLATLVPVKYCIADVAEHLKDCTVAQFDEEKQKWYIDTLLKSGQSTGTIDRRLTVLIAALNHAVARKILASAPSVLRPPRVHTSGVKRFSVDELKAVYDQARTENERTMLLLWVTSLCRPGQVLDLTWDRVDFEEHTIDYRVPGAKITNKRRAKVMMPPTVEAWLRARKRPEGHVLLNSRIAKVETPLKTFKNHIKRIVERAGLSGSAYRIRKAASSYLTNKGVAYVQVQAMLAHKAGDAETYRYIEADLPPVLRVLEQLLAEIAPRWLPLWQPPADARGAAAKSLSGLVAANDPVLP